MIAAACGCQLNLSKPSPQPSQTTRPAYSESRSNQVFPDFRLMKSRQQYCVSNPESRNIDAEHKAVVRIGDRTVALTVKPGTIIPAVETLILATGRRRRRLLSRKRKSKSKDKHEKKHDCKESTIFHRTILSLVMRKSLPDSSRVNAFRNASKYLEYY